MSSNSRLRQITLGLVLAMVFVSGIAPAFSMAGTAAAQDGTNDTMPTSEDERKCSEVGTFMFLDPECQPHYGSGTVENVNGKEAIVYEGVQTEGRTAEQVHWDVFADGVLMADATDQYYTEAESRTNQTMALAYSDVKLAALEVRNNGGSKSEARRAANDAINNLYAQPQKSFFIQQNRQALRAAVMNQTVVHTDDLPYRDVFVNVDGDRGAQLYVEKGNVTLWNGEEMTIHRAYGYGVNTNAGHQGNRYTVTYYDGGHRESRGSFEDYNGEHFLNIVSPTGETIMLMDAREANETLQTINDRRRQALNNVGPIVDGIWATCNPDECKPSDVLTSTERIHKMSTNYDTTGDYAPAAAILADYNYATNSTAAFNVTWDNAGPNGTISEGPSEMTAKGQLFAMEGAFPNGVEAGETYTASNQTGEVLFIYQDGSQAREVTFNGTYTINKMWDPQTGETYNSTSVQNTDFGTTDTEDLNRQIEEIMDERQQLEVRINSTGGGPLVIENPFDDMDPTGAAIGVALALAALFVIGLLISALKPY